MPPALEVQSFNHWTTWETHSTPFYGSAISLGWFQVFFIRSSLDGHLGCFPGLAFVNSAAVHFGGACVFSNSSFVQMYGQEWDC